MEKKAVSGIMLTLLIGMLTLESNIQPVKASGTIYIRADGSVYPSRTPIQRDGDIYTFTDNIYGSIVVERDNIVIDGAGYELQGTGAWDSKGILLSQRNNVTSRNMTVKWFDYGIYLIDSSNNIVFSNNLTNINIGILFYESSNNRISGNNIKNNGDGIWLLYSSRNNISENNIVNYCGGIWLHHSSNINISRNNITNKRYGIWVYYSSNSNVSGNNIANNVDGIGLYESSNNCIYHNNFVNNTNQVHDYSWDHPSLAPPSTNIWDDGNLSGGNYWSEYTIRYPDAKELNDSGIWDTPYFIDENNQDNYPLVEPWSPLPTTIIELKTEIEERVSTGEIDNQGIAKSLIAKLNTVQKLIDKGKIDEAKMVLEDFVIQVQELSGIHIAVEAADILIKSVEYFLFHL